MLFFGHFSMKDYYGMPFPGTALAGRDGGLANNPYVGKQAAIVVIKVQRLLRLCK